MVVVSGVGNLEGGQVGGEAHLVSHTSNRFDFLMTLIGTFFLLISAALWFLTFKKFYRFFDEDVLGWAQAFAIILAVVLMICGIGFLADHLENCFQVEDNPPKLPKSKSKLELVPPEVGVKDFIDDEQTNAKD